MLTSTVWEHSKPILSVRRNVKSATNSLRICFAVIATFHIAATVVKMPIAKEISDTTQLPNFETFYYKFIKKLLKT